MYNEIIFELPFKIYTMKKLEELINTYRDFPKRGVDFKDVLGILHEPEVFYEFWIGIIAD